MASKPVCDGRGEGRWSWTNPGSELGSITRMDFTFHSSLLGISERKEMGQWKCTAL